MPSVDNRIVRIEFDNASFEKKVHQTLESITKLNQALKMEGAQKGLSELDKSTTKVHKLNDALKLEGAKKGMADLNTEAKKFSVGAIGTIATHVESVNAKFVAMAAVGIAALASITAAAVAAGAQVANALVITPALQGFKEYELNIGSIQTILANTKQQGTTLDDVNKALQNLNVYSDKTIYNFAQMAKNIGTFTAAGVDLETSTQSIKGIANLAAISGSTSDQASTAMYQLSQAIAAGSLKLMDWNSVVNAGMGGEVFKQALFETGKALKTIPEVPINQTFKEWTDAGHSFRESLHEGWITSEVLTTTLQGFTGEMSEAQLVAKGFTAEQAKNLMELGALGVDSATKVRTLTGLLATTKEQLATGFADTFRLIVGDFQEATTMFTAISKTIGGIVGRSAEARNKLLEGWKAFGGRTVLLEGFKDLWNNILRIIKPIQKAFRDIFPATTVKQLLLMTKGFADFTKSLKPSEETIRNLRRAFRGFFAILSIGWTILKEGIKFAVGLGRSLTGALGPGILSLLADIGDFFTDLQKGLVKGKIIQTFFANLTKILKAPIPIVEKIKKLFSSIFDGFDTGAGDKVSTATGRIGDRIESIRKVIEPVIGFLKKVGSLLATVGKVIGDFFTEIGSRLAEVMQKGDFKATMDTLNTVFIGGIAIFLAKLAKSGLNLKLIFQQNFDIGGGLFRRLGRTFDELTNTLKAMQTEIKSKALLNIAIAVAVLTASVVALSLIDSVALTKALAAMAVGFGQLVAVFAVINKLALSPASAVTFTALAVGMSILSVAILLLAAAARTLSKLDWNELARGLTGVAALLAAVTAAVIPLSKMKAALIRTGLSLIAIAIALNILAGAVKLMATMEWSELGRGLAGVAGGLVAIVAAMKALPSSTVLSGVGIIAVAIGLTVLAGAIKLFSKFDWGELGKGLLGVAGALVVIAGAMQGMPANLPLTAAGLVLIGIALQDIAKALITFGGMDWGEIGKGLVALAGSLLVLAVATNAMTAAIGGAIAIAIVSASLLLLAKVLGTMADLGWDEVGKGIGVIAAALAAIGVAAGLLTPVIPSMLALGVALAAIGVSFVFFGAGAFLAAKAFEVLAKAGASGSENVLKALKTIAKAVPAFAASLAEGLIEFIDVIGKAAPRIVNMIAKLITQLINKFIQLLPKYQEAVIRFIMSGLEVIRDRAPQIIETGFFVLLTLLKGIRDNISEIVNVVSEIITNFLDAFAEEVPNIVESLINLWYTILTEMAFGVGELMAKIGPGLAWALIRGFISGLNEAFPGLLDWFRELPGKIINVVKSLFGIKSPSTEFVKIGVDIIQGLLNGLIQMVPQVMMFFATLPLKILGWVGDVLGILKDKGLNIIQGFLNGVIEKGEEVISWFKDFPGKLKDAIVGVLNAAGNAFEFLKGIGLDIVQGFWNGITEKWDAFIDWLWDKIASLPGILKDFFGLGSPSKLMMGIGENVMIGFHIGIEKQFKPIEESLARFSDDLSNMSEFNPVITPVLDLTDVTKQASKISDYISNNPALTPTFSSAQASKISSDLNIQQRATDVSSESTVTQPSFTQNIYAPEQLSTADIYKQTRNQITLAKEELKIP